MSRGRRPTLDIERIVRKLAVAGAVAVVGVALSAHYLSSNFDLGFLEAAKYTIAISGFVLILLATTRSQPV